MESEVPVISIDYMWMGQENPSRETEESGSTPILVLHDRRTKMKYARMVEAKGQHWYSQITLVRIIRQLGYNRIVLKSDGESSIVALKEAVAKELKDDHIEVIMEESPTGSSGSNGEVERAIREIQGQIRTMKIALESRTGKIIDPTSNILPWMVTQAAALLSRIQTGADGRTAYERWKGRKYTRQLIEFGEEILVRMNDKLTDKMEARWKNAIFLGMTERSSEYIVGLPEGCIKVRDAKRLGSEDERWKSGLLDKMKGTPWKPDPGKDGTDPPSRLFIPTEPGRKADTPVGSEPSRRGFP